ncbi:metallophosphoesterase [Desulfocurvus sp. DL9XJH121]
MTTFLHAADIHLDSPLSGLSRYEGAPVDEVRAATRRALGNLVDYALAEAVPLLVIAGDVYDGDWQDFQTGLHFVAQMARLERAGVRVVIARGNHDAASVMTRSLPLPGNVTVLSDAKAESVVFEDLGLAVHGMSYPVREVRENLVPAYPEPMPDLFNIGLLHTAVSGAPGHEPYAPCRVEELAAKGYQYWALGHVHEHKVLADAPLVVFSGCLQGRTIRETGPKGCVRVDVSPGGGADMDFVPLDVMRWAHLDLDASEARTPDQVGELFARACADALADAGGRPLAVRATVRGRSEAHAALVRDEEAFRADLRARAVALSGGSAWVEKVLIRTSQPVDREALRGSDTPQGDLLRFVDELAADPGAFAQVRPDLAKLATAVGELRDSGLGLPDLDDDAVRRALLEEVCELVLPLFDAGGDGA